MAVKVGLIGFGFMGKMHMSIYAKNPEAELVAICDATAERLTRESLAQGGNIDIGDLGDFDFEGLSKYSDFDKFIKHKDIDVVDICLPTYLHCEYTVKALQAGKHVICEKPIAMNVEQADRMIQTAEKAGKELFIGHCIRFWPEYAWLKQVVDQKRYGAVRSAIFKRVSTLPTWSWENWILDEKLSGDAALDLHIHDTDYISYLFGKPKDICSRGASVLTDGLDIITTHYIYDHVPLVLAIGSWGSPGAFPFEMAFTVLCEKATIKFSTSDSPALSVYTADGGVENPELDPTDGYAREIDYFLGCLKQGRKPETVTPQDARNALELVLKEIENAAG